MKSLTVVAPYHPGLPIDKTLESLRSSDLVERVVIVSHESLDLEMAKCDLLIGSLSSSKALNQILEGIRTKCFLLLPGTQQISIEPGALDKLVSTAETTQAGLVYSDFYDGRGHERKLHTLIDYQPGSVRDDFDFGAMVLFSVGAVRKALQKWGTLPDVKFASLYDLRLKLSVDHAIHHLPEPLYTVTKTSEASSGEKLFAYVDPRNRAVQGEMEIVFTDYLRKIGAFLPPERLKKVEPSPGSYPVEASVVVPVRNRRETIPDAVKSALSQETDFPFNVIVVDNHSTDGTTTTLTDLASEYLKLKHIVPTRTDLGIGGCWNEAVYSTSCGRYVVQLDSDDIYSRPDTLQKLSMSSIAVTMQW